MNLATNLVVTKIEIDALGEEILEPAMQAAEMCADSTHKTRGGYVALGKVQGSDLYKVAIRRVKTERKFQLACDCKHWIFRCNKLGTLCKHQKAFLANPMDHFVTAPGVAFAQTVEAELMALVAQGKAKKVA